MSTEKPQEKYLLDTNILFEFSLWLPISLNKVFWTKLENSLTLAEWVLLDVVVDEVTYPPELKYWCKQQGKKGLIKKITPGNRERAVEINNQYKMINDASGKSTADTYLIAFAEEHKLTVFSREKVRVKDTDLYKIPDVCKILSIKSLRNPEVFLNAIKYKN